MYCVATLILEYEKMVKAITLEDTKWSVYTK